MRNKGKAGVSGHSGLLSRTVGGGVGAVGRATLGVL